MSGLAHWQRRWLDSFRAATERQDTQGADAQQSSEKVRKLPYIRINLEMDCWGQIVKLAIHTTFMFVSGKGDILFNLIE